MKGSCLCGAVKFEVEGDFDRFFLCHCSYCRKDTGSAHAANLFTKSALLTWLSGNDLVQTYLHPGTRHIRSFCSICSALPTQVEGGAVVLPAGCLDEPSPLSPSAHLYLASKADWDDELSEVPGFDGLPTSE